MALVLALWGLSLTRPSTNGIRLATNGLLTTLWQVQAAAVSLALALGVFVFGLLPRSRGAVLYRAFLRRSWVRFVVVAGIASMVFDGIVLLGYGNQVPSTPTTTDGHGWAVTLACCVGLLSVASIALLFGRTIAALDPAMATSAQIRDRRATVGLALRDELLEEFGYDVMRTASVRLGFELIPGYYPHGQAIRSRHSDRPAVVYDVSLHKLAKLAHNAKKRHLQPPKVHIWPGQTLLSDTPVLTIDTASRRVDQRRARRCVAVRQLPTDYATQLLNALHADVLDHVRGDRPIDAINSMQAISQLLELAWQADQVRSPARDELAASLFLFYPTRKFRTRIINSLVSEVRAGAISQDEQIRNATARLPRELALLALGAHAEESLRACLSLYPGLYDAVVGDVTDGGRLTIPDTGVGRRRITQIFENILAFTRADIPRTVEQANRSRRADSTSQRLSTDFVIDQLSVGNSQVLRTLRRALDLGDITTVLSVLPEWKMPDTQRLLLTEQLDAEASQQGDTASQAPTLHTSLRTERVELEAMKLRLLSTALQYEQRQRSLTTATASLQAASTQEPTVRAVLDALEPSTYWPALTAAARQASQEDVLRIRRDDELSIPGVFALEGAAHVGLMRAFVQAVLVRRELAGSTTPDHEFILDHGEELLRTTAAVRSDRADWARRYGVSEPEMAERAVQLADQVSRTRRTAARERALAQLAVPIPADVPGAFRDGAVEAFRKRDIVLPLFAWAGQPARRGGAPGSQIKLYEDDWQRAELVGDPAVRSRAADEFGARCAASVPAYLIAAAEDQQPAELVTLDTLSERMTTSIKALRAQRAQRPGVDHAAAGIAVLVPDQLHRNLIDVLALSGQDRSAAPADAASELSTRRNMLRGGLAPERGHRLLCGCGQVS